MASITFTPSGTAAVLRVLSFPQSGAMPAADTGNTDVTVQLGGTATAAWIAFAAGAQCGPGVPGALELRPGQAVLLTSNPALPIGPQVLFGDRGAGAATACTIVGMMTGGQVTITRGTATAAITF